MSLRLLHLISDRDRRGAQVAAVGVSNELASRGVVSEVLALGNGGGGGPLDVDVAPTNWRARARLMRSYDLVIAHGSTTLEAAVTAVPRRFLYRSIGDPSYWLGRPTRRVSTAVRYQLAAGIVALYPGAAAAIHRLTGVPRSRISVVPNAVASPSVDDRPAPRLPSDRRNVLFVGALTWEKQVDQLIRAVSLLDDTGLVLLGDGPLRASLQSQAEDALGDLAQFVGVVDDPWPYYRHCDVVALTSRTEGVPACILEAAMVATPAVAPFLGGIDTVVDDGVSGRLYRPGDGDELAGALRAALDDHVAMGAAARHLVSSAYSFVSVGDRWMDVVERVANARTSRAL